MSLKLSAQDVMYAHNMVFWFVCKEWILRKGQFDLGSFQGNLTRGGT
jgi:hypothetical protein